jgi:thiamine biosynthesis lipoprotein
VLGLRGRLLARSPSWPVTRSVAVMHQFRRSVEPVLGTRLTMRIESSSEPAARAAFDAALAEADRLERLLTAYQPDSAFAVWRRGELSNPGPEVVAVLDLAARWHRRTAGAFSPLLGPLMQRWADAEREQHAPGRQEMVDLAASVAVLPYRVDGSRVVAIGDCRGVDVHGVAKGWVVDQMVGAALATRDVVGVLVDAGGDMRHASALVDSQVTIAVEDPHSPADNAPPLTVVRFANRAIATSGGGRRGWTIDGEWYGHLLDPRSGWPLGTTRSATILASSAAEADVLASAGAVLGRQLVGIAPQCAALVADGADGLRTVWRSATWPMTVEEL